MKIEIQNGVCATFSREKGQYYGGRCPFQHFANKTNRMYSEMPSDPDMLDDAMCGPYNRKGFMCGECIDGYGPPVYSYTLKCADCSNMSPGYAIILFLFLELIPGTFFFICLVLFRLNVTFGPLLGYVLFCQVYAYTVQHNVYVYELMLTDLSRPLRLLLNFSLILSEFWNLRFFKPIIPPFCISDKLSGVHVQMLDFVPATYPIVLIIMTCILMELHARNYRMVHILWKPFSIILNKTNITTGVTSDAVIHTFATIVLLSAFTVLYNNYIILRKSHVFQSSDCGVYRSIMFFDPTVTWLGPKHLLYIVLALIPFVLLLIIPFLLLCLYPTRLYRYISTFLSARKRLAITAFAEALHSCFKDGLNGTRDYRAFPGVFLLGGVVGPLAVGEVTKHLGAEIGMGFTLSLLALLLAHVRPCKSDTANLSLSYHVLVAGILSISRFLWKSDILSSKFPLELLLILVPAVSHFLIILWAVYRVSRGVLLRCSGAHSERRAMDDFVAAIKVCYYRQRYSYQVLSDV